MKYFILTGIVILFVKPCYPQQDSLWLEEKYGSELEISSSDDEENYLHDYLEEITENPVNINSAELNDLLRVPGMSNSDASKILEYRKKTGYIFSVFELNSIDGLDPIQLRNYFLYLSTEDRIDTEVITSKPKTHTLKTTLRSRLIKGLQNRRGYAEGVYFGNQYKIYNRLKITSDNNYSFGILTEKDPGEQDYLDHTAFYFQVKDRGIIKSFIAGDYNIEFGKGLVIWGPFGFSKTPAAFSGYRPGRNTVPYLSTDEGRYLRGSAINFRYKSLEITTYYSNREKDASLDSTGGKICSLINDGYHRSESEISKKGKIREIVSGAHLDFISDYFTAGLLFNNLKTNLSFAEDVRYPSGNSFNNFSFTYSIVLKKLLLSGEASYFKGSIAHLNSINFDISERIKAIFVFRNSPQNYKALLSASSAGESGAYAGITITALPGNMNFYYDTYKLNGPSHLFPVTGNELFGDYSINASSSILLRARYKRDSRNSNDDYLTSKNIREIITTEISYKLSRSVKWKWRFDYSHYSESSANVNEHGYAFYQDAVFTLTKALELYGRITFFNSKNYQARIYQYEKDLTGAFSMNPLYDEGIRWYLGFNISLMKTIKLQCRYYETYKPDAKAMGSGYNEIEGNIDNQFSLQMDLTL